ncbi:signal peptide peptidase SppA [Salibacterium qingdaonense]|uniref:Signal peptide peptidase A. Serine peptidase. MEROPS family S49 n=1 Tax=Salibacterium qingdaonense TaxID=266892 RepID=A0A1I4NM39_9BACI|nr:signal peptide peptidase SppA [Salibacterium qingdaonense]SFM16602.1 signal peptide peptidase A. Serine peptidase. MEROPS family S49 [Salibacterium qingdaonense]
MKAKRWVALGIAALLFVVSISFQFAGSLATTNMDNVVSGSENNAQQKVMEQGGSGKIAVIELQGTIQDTGQTSGIMSAGTYNHRQFLRTLESAGENSSIKGIILEVNTPGGGVVESDEIHDKIVDIQEETGKPVYVSMGNTAASGGYYIAAPADNIVAHPATVTGSIGVIMQSVNYSGLAEELGIDFQTIKSGQYKDIMSGSRDMTENEEQILQRLVDDFYQDFVSVIANGRGMSEEEVRDIGDGRVYSGEQAQELDLVDELGSLDDTISLMKEEEGMNDPTVVRYQSNAFSFNQFLGSSARSLILEDTDLLGIKDLMMDTNAPRAMYLYTE